MTLRQHYFNILGLNEDATLNDLKAAFRNKAKELHPDVNEAKDAHEKFIELGEAFEYLQNLFTGKIYNSKSKSFQNKRYSYNRSHDQWTDEQRHKARERAAFYARMKYENFVKSKYYQSIKSLTVIFNGLLHLLIYSILTIPLIGLATMNFQIVWGALFINVIFFPLTIHVFKNIPRPGIKSLWSSSLNILKKKTAQLVILSIFNIIIFFNVILNTLFPYWIYFSVVFSFTTAIIFFTHKNHFVLRFGIAPFIIHVFFIANFIFSSDEQIETYHYTNLQTGKYEMVNYSFRTRRSSLVYLEDNAYKNFFGIRFFFNFAKVDSHSYIQYRFEEGLFGVRVLKNYQFLYDFES